MVAYTSALLVGANLLALAHAAPAQPVCQAVITVITGSPIWVPRADPTSSVGWGAWSSKSSSVTLTTSSVSKSSTVLTTSVKTTSPGGGFYPSSTSSVSTTVITTTSKATTVTTPATTTTTTPEFFTTTTTTKDVDTTTTTAVITTTSSSAAAPAATCPAAGTPILSTEPSGSCECDFVVNCNRRATPNADTKFWERKDNEIVETLNACLEICNDNSECDAVIWTDTDGASSNDFKRCWQVKGLPQPDNSGYGQLSYKDDCSGSCSTTYTASS